MKYLLPVLFVLLSQVSCRKEADTHLKDNSSTTENGSDPTDSLMGVYIGQVMTIHESMSPPTDTVPRLDTGYTIDTIYIDKLSAETFQLRNKDWQAWTTGSDLEDQGIYKFQVESKYNSSGYHNGTSISFLTSADSIYMSA